MTSCKWCGIDIYWSNEAGIYVPYEDPGLSQRHDCPKRPPMVPKEIDRVDAKESAQQPAKKVPVKPLTDEEIIFVRKLRWQLKGLTEGATSP